MDNLPTAAEAAALLTDAHKVPRAAHFDICVEAIKQAIQAGQRECSFRSWCLQDADLEPLRAKGYKCVIGEGGAIAMSW